MCMLNYLSIKPKNIFECFICLWKWFYTFVLLVCVFVLFSKNWFRGSFGRSLRLRASRESCLREINFFSIHTESHYFLASVLRLSSSCEMVFRKKLEIFLFHTEAIATVLRLTASRESFWASMALFATISLLPNLWKKCVFNFYVADVISFQKLLTSLALPLSTQKPFLTQTSSIPSLFSTILTSRYVF